MRYFDLSWSDLDYSKQADMIKEVADSLIEFWEEEGNQFMSRDWHVKPKTWQEAYCREYKFGYGLWSDMDENSDEFQDIDWEQELREAAEEEAETRCSKAVRSVEIEVNTGI